MAAASSGGGASAVAASGAGGGGGYGGGGGGGPGGGGGGSSFAVANATNVSSGPSTRSADGQVTITYDPSTDSCPTPVVVTPKFTG
jgi:hypothetical protein